MAVAGIDEDDSGSAELSNHGHPDFNASERPLRQKISSHVRTGPFYSNDHQNEGPDNSQRNCHSDINDNF